MELKYFTSVKNISSHFTFKSHLYGIEIASRVQGCKGASV